MNVAAISSVSGVGTTGPLAGANGVGGVGSVGATAPTADASGAGDASGGSFLDALGNAFGQLNGQLNAADSAMADFAAGGSADLHTVMLQMEEASISLSAGVQVRDKLLEAYQQIMQTQL